MPLSTIRILLVEDNPWDAQLVTAMLTRADKRSGDTSASPKFVIHAADGLAAALATLREQPVDVVLLDLMLPDSEGIETLKRVREGAPEIPIVVQTSLDDEGTGLEAMQAGAQDYLVKGHVEVDLLKRTLRYAIERQRLQTMVRQLSLTDDLTGLLNRRGFYTHARQQLKVARRSQQACVLLLGDLNDFKDINDGFGHAEGDRALTSVADVLRLTFRESDLIARVGGDEFMVLAIDTNNEEGDELGRRVRDRLSRAHTAYGLPLPLSMSIGRVAIDPTASHAFEELVAMADTAMYEQKRTKQGRRANPRDDSSVGSHAGT
jgi:diguanylate cyclase (GGDEF)-like protein